jgi:hypothetical protein
MSTLLVTAKLNEVDSLAWLADVLARNSLTCAICATLVCG